MIPVTSRTVVMPGGALRRPAACGTWQKPPASEDTA
jgi:hypothetical protein